MKKEGTLTLMFGKETHSMFGAIENKHRVTDSAVCQVTENYSIHPSFLPDKLPNHENPQKLFLEI